MKKFIFLFALAIVLVSCNGKISIVENADGTKTVSGSLEFSKKAAEELAAIVGSEIETSCEFQTTMPKDFEVKVEKSAEFYEKLDEESKAYVDLLMAPIFTGEKMSVGEYETLLASVYGADIAKELVSGKIEITTKRLGGKLSKKVVTAGNFLCGIE